VKYTIPSRRKISSRKSDPEGRMPRKKEYFESKNAPDWKKCRVPGEVYWTEKAAGSFKPLMAINQIQNPQGKMCAVCSVIDPYASDRYPRRHLGYRKESIEPTKLCAHRDSYYRLISL
jgi:hypothetical protein